MNRLKSIIQKTSKTIAGINIWINADGGMNMRLVILLKERNSFKILTAATYDNISDAIKQVPERSPLVISVDGYGIIHKTVDRNDTDEGITKVLPNAKISDLYIQKIYHESTGKVIFTVARKEKIDEIIIAFNDLRFYPYNIILGPFGIISLLPLISPDEKIDIPGYSIDIRDRMIFSFERAEDSYTPKKIDFGSQVILSDYLVAFSNCIAFFAPPGLITNNISSIEIQRKEYLSKKLIYISGLSILATIFLMLAINMFLYSRYASENRFLAQRIQYGQRLIKETDSLKKILSGREAFVEKRGNSSSKKMSFFSDRLASVIPGSITLERINVYPLETASNNKNMPKFRQNAIIITGQLNSSGALERLIKQSYEFRWIKTADLINYSDRGPDPAYFTIEIKVE